MKKTILTTTIFVALAMIIGMTMVSRAEDQTEARREAFTQGFEQLISNAKEGLAKPPVQEPLFKDGSQTETISKFAISPVSVPATTPNTVPTSCQLGIKVWFQLENGACFNPIKRKMGVKEKFYIHVQAAVPVYVSLFQNYPDSLPISRQVYPDAQYPESFKAIQPGQSTRLPVLFEMDDNTLDEIMSMVVVRADAPQIQSTLSTQATASVTSTGGNTVVTAQATTGTPGTLKEINDSIVKGSDKDSKFIISGPGASTPNITTVPDDVAFYMFGAGFIGQWQLTLKK